MNSFGWRETMPKYIIPYVLLFLLIVNNSLYSQDLSLEKKALRGQTLSMVNLGRHKEALSSLRELYKEYPNDLEIGKAYLDALFATDNMQEALTHMDDVYRDKINSREYYEFRIKIYEAQSEYLKAAKLYQYMYENHINNDDGVLWLIGERYSWSGDNKNAVKYFELYEAKNPLTVDQKMLFADVLFWAMKYDKAVLKYQQIKDQVLADEKKSLQYCQAFSNVNHPSAVNACVEAANAWPDNLELKAQYAYVLYNAGDIDEAEKLFDELAQLNPTDLELQENAIRVLASVKRYERAKAIAVRTIELVPDHQPIRLWYARILSWNREYSFSIDQYDILISQDNNKRTYYIERARVLSWMRDYRKSEDSYKAAEKRFRDDAAIRYESRAFYDKNRNYYRWAKINLDALRKIEPNNDNAKIESALLYSELGLWDEATLLYQNILLDAPLMTMPQQAFDKNLIYQNKIRLELGASFYEADSNSRLADVQYYDVYSSARAPINNKLFIYNNLSERFYRFPNMISRLNRYRNDIGLQYYWRPNMWMDMAYGYADKTDKVESSHFAHLDFYLEYYEPFLINFKYQRDDVEDSVITIYRHLQKDDYRLRVKYDIQKRFYFGADYTYSNLTDGNTKRLYGADLTYNMTYEPRRLTLLYRYENYGFKEPRDWYFAPNSFHTHGPGLEWRHYLNGDELFWGSNDTYYTFRYGMNFDSTGAHGHKFYFDLHKDWTDRLSTHLEYEQTMYEHQGVYGQRGLKTYIRLYW